MKRGEGVHEPEGPILVCTRNDDLQSIVDATPAERKKGPCGRLRRGRLRRGRLRRLGEGP